MSKIQKVKLFIFKKRLKIQNYSETNQKKEFF